MWPTLRPWPRQDEGLMCLPVAATLLKASGVPGPFTYPSKCFRNGASVILSFADQHK